MNLEPYFASREIEANAEARVTGCWRVMGLRAFINVPLRVPFKGSIRVPVSAETSAAKTLGMPRQDPSAVRSEGGRASLAHDGV